MISASLWSRFKLTSEFICEIKMKIIKFNNNNENQKLTSSLHFLPS